MRFNRLKGLRPCRVAFLLSSALAVGWQETGCGIARPDLPSISPPVIRLRTDSKVERILLIEFFELLIELRVRLIKFLRPFKEALCRNSKELGRV